MFLLIFILFCFSTLFAPTSSAHKHTPHHQYQTREPGPLAMLTTHSTSRWTSGISRTSRPWPHRAAKTRGNLWQPSPSPLHRTESCSHKSRVLTAVSGWVEKSQLMILQELWDMLTVEIVHCLYSFLGWSLQSTNITKQCC